MVVRDMILNIYYDHFMSFGSTNLAGKISISSKPGTLSPSKKLKQLALLVFKLGLYPSSALYLGL